MQSPCEHCQMPFHNWRGRFTSKHLILNWSILPKKEILEYTVLGLFPKTASHKHVWSKDKRDEQKEPERAYWLLCCMDDALEAQSCTSSRDMYRITWQKKKKRIWGPVRWLSWKRHFFKPNNLNSVPRTHRKWRHWLPNVVLWPLTAHHGAVCSQAIVKLKLFKNSMFLTRNSDKST